MNTIMTTAKANITMKKHALFLLAAASTLSATSAAARNLEITVADIRSDRGSILVMATVEGVEKPFYAMTAAKAGTVVVSLEGIDADKADVSLFHDENGNFKMDMGDRGPIEGYAARKCNLPETENAVTLKLYYPQTGE